MVKGKTANPTLKDSFHQNGAASNTNTNKIYYTIIFIKSTFKVKFIALISTNKAAPNDAQNYSSLIY